MEDTSGSALLGQGSQELQHEQQQQEQQQQQQQQQEQQQEQPHEWERQLDGEVVAEQHFRVKELEFLHELREQGGTKSRAELIDRQLSFYSDWGLRVEVFGLEVLVFDILGKPEQATMRSSDGIETGICYSYGTERQKAGDRRQETWGGVKRRRLE